MREVDSSLLFDGENLYEVDNRTANVLQSLDIDQNLNNGIEIDQDIVSRLDVDYDTVPSKDSELQVFKSKMRSEGADIPTVNSSEKHIIETILSNGLYRVEGNKTQELSFGDNGDILIKEDEKVVDDASYYIDNNNTITIREDDSIATQTAKITTGQQYIPMTNDTLWFSKRLADESKSSHSPSQGQISNSTKRIYP